MKTELYPIQCTPIFKEYLWGGDRISKVYPNHAPPKNRCAESWEISDRADGMSLISNGSWAGKTLRAYIESNPLNILGTACESKQFPLLIKIIDARRDLSIQVHPSRETVKKTGGDPKAEMWYFLDEATQIIHGLRPGVQKSDFLNALKNKTLPALLQTLPVQPREAVFTPGGCVHSIGAGNLILEIQCNSNTTYRIHDWDRLDTNGTPRELHIEKALQAIDWNPPPSPPLIKPTLLSDEPGYQLYDLLSCSFFQVQTLNLNGTCTTLLTGETFHTLFVVDGTATLSWGTDSANIAAGTTLLIPAALGSYTLEGTATILCTMLPHSKR